MQAYFKSCAISANIPLAKADHMDGQPKSRERVLHSAYHKAKTNHRVKININPLGKYIPLRKQNLWGGIEYLLNNNLIYDLICLQNKAQLFSG